MTILRTANVSALILASLLPAPRADGASVVSQAVQTQNGAAFDIAKAMEMFYGNYDVKKQASFISLPKQETSLPGPGEEQMIVKVLLNSSGDGDGAQTVVLVTYAVPSADDTYQCHACAPVLGVAFFSRHGERWLIDASNRAVTTAGSFGKPPANIHIATIGKNQRGVKVLDVGGGQGEMSVVLTLLVAWKDTVNLALQRVVADNNQGMCGPEGGGLPCYTNHRTLHFIPNDRSGYYDVELTLTGTDFPLADGKAVTKTRKVSGIETFKFDDGKYVRASMQGDITFLDDFVAKAKRPTPSGAASN